MEDESNNRQMRRIELDSDSDFRHIYNQIWNVAKQKIEKHFEESMVEDAELKSRVEELVADYVNNMFSLATPNITINGNEASLLTSACAEVIYEPYDRNLSENLRSLQDQIERRTAELSRLRRRIPAELRRKWGEDGSDLAFVNRTEAMVKATLEERNRRGQQLGIGIVDGDGNRVWELAETRRRAVEAIEQLRLSLPAISSRAIQAAEVVDTVLWKGKGGGGGGGVVNKNEEVGSGVDAMVE